MSIRHDINLTRRLLERVTSKSHDLATEPLRESAEVFLSQQRFEKERQQFFLHTPQVIGFSSELKDANSYLATEVCGQPILVTRDANHRLRAFINACLHKGAKVASGRGVKARLNCQFHGWSYTHDGKLQGRAMDDCFPAQDSDTELVALPVAETRGLIVVGATPQVSQHDVEHHLDEIAAELEGADFDAMHFLDCRQLEVDANWKLVAGVSYESYHFATLHRNSVAELFYANAISDFFGRHSRWCFPSKEIAALADKSESDWPGHLPGAISYAFFPGTVLITSATNAQLLRTEPGRNPGHSVIYYSGIFSDEIEQEQARGAFEFGGDVFAREDLAAVAQCQQGLAATGNDIIIGRNEPVVQFWHKQWRSNLAD